MAQGVSTVTLAVTTTGSSGSATGTAVSPAINGFLLDLYFDFHASAPATTDVTVSYTTPADGNIIVLTNTNTDVLHMPRKQASDNAGAAISGVYDCYPVDGTLTVSVAGCDALTAAVTVRARYYKVLSV